MSKLSQAIAEGDGISFVVEVSDAKSARAAEAQGADALAALTNANAVRVSSQLPFLHLGRMFDAQGSAADAVVIKPDLAIAELHDATPDDVAELERSGVDAVLVSPDGLATLVTDDPPEV